MSFGAVPIATPFLLVHSSADKWPEPSMSGNFLTSALAPPAVLGVGGHALHIAIRSNRNWCAKAVDAASPLAHAFLSRVHLLGTALMDAVFLGAALTELATTLTLGATLIVLAATLTLATTLTFDAPLIHLSFAFSVDSLSPALIVLVAALSLATTLTFDSALVQFSTALSLGLAFSVFVAGLLRTALLMLGSTLSLHGLIPAFLGNACLCTTLVDFGAALSLGTALIVLGTTFSLTTTLIVLGPTLVLDIAFMLLTNFCGVANILVVAMVVCPPVAPPDSASIHADG